MYHDKSPHAYRTHIYTRMHMHPHSYPYRTYAHIHPHARATAHAFRIRRPRTPPHPHLHLHPKTSIHPFVCPPDPPPTFGLSICPPIPHPNQSYARYLFDAGAPSHGRRRPRRRPSRAVLHGGHDVRGARGPVRSGASARSRQTCLEVCQVAPTSPCLCRSTDSSTASPSCNPVVDRQGRRCVQATSRSSSFESSQIQRRAGLGASPRALTSHSAHITASSAFDT